MIDGLFILLGVLMELDTLTDGGDARRQVPLIDPPTIERREPVEPVIPRVPAGPDRRFSHCVTTSPTVG